jgi:hypothetical protein
MPTDSPGGGTARHIAPWKRLAIVSASAGAGLAVTMALIVGGLLWYSSRPHPPKPWNTSALKATYDYIDTEGDKRTIVFYYTLENKTDADYKVESGVNATIALHLQRQDSLSVERDESYVKIDYPLFVPAKQRSRFAIHLLAYPYQGKEVLKADASLEERRSFRKALAGYVSKDMGNLDGFVLLDEANRYQINFPKGW